MVPTPEFGDYYVNAEVVLPVGGDMQRGKVVCRKRDVDGTRLSGIFANPESNEKKSSHNTQQSFIVKSLNHLTTGPGECTVV